MGLRRLGDLVGAEAGRSLTEAERARPIAGVTADSRAVRPDFLFAALPGIQADGARFVPEALERGAAAVLGRPEIGKPPASQAVILLDRNPRRRFAELAARFYEDQPRVIAAVTGTNGKTSVVGFLRQIWERLGSPAASLGTLGVISKTITRDFGMTTPDPVELHRTLAELKGAGIDHLAMEASSHGLSQYRLDGVRLAAAAITNLTRDHLDYHASFEDYAYAKLRLFGEVMAPGGVAVINADTPVGVEAESLSWARGHRVLSVGAMGRDLKLESTSPRGTGQRLAVTHEGTRYDIAFPLAGGFQASNALIAAGLAIGTGAEARAVFAALEQIEGAPGRLQHVTTLANGAAVYVDYAHTPDALQTVIAALRPHTAGKLHLVFGCGGDRDKGKRPQMGRIAIERADRVIVTDDNPRTEDAAQIRAAILAEAKGAAEIADRADAIALAMMALGPGDVLIVAGKGHESGQIIGDAVKPFSDAEEILRIAAKLGGQLMSAPLWTSEEAAAATGGTARARFTASGLSIDTRTLEPGDLFIALMGDNRDGHEFVGAAFAKGAAAALVSAPVTAKGALLTVPDTMEGLRALGAASRARSRAKILAVTGSVGKTSTKEALRLVLGHFGKTHASAASYNNHWGVPLSLARMAQGDAFGVFEIGMNHAGEIAPLAKLAEPHVAIITTVEPVHMEFFGSVEGIAEEKGEIFSGLVPGGTAIINRDSPYFTLLRNKAERFGAHVLGFGAHGEADAQLVAIAPEGEGSAVTAMICGRPLRYRLGAPGRHIAQNSLAVLAVVQALGLDLEDAAAALADLVPPKGRGARSIIESPAGRVLLIDESYNANPASMKAALALLGESRPDGAGRRIAVLGDMLELGAGGPAYHAGLAPAIEAADADLVFLSGPLMEHLWDVLPPYRRGAKAQNAAQLAELLIAELKAGDVIMVKGSFGSRMGQVVEALKALGGRNAV